MESPWPVLESLADEAAAVAALPASGPLPVRAVVVASERHAHALRRALVKLGHRGILAGTRFVDPATLASEILVAAGWDFAPGEEELRPARLLALIQEGLPLEHFDLELLRSTPGWPEAFDGVIDDLEEAGLDPERIPSHTPHWSDIRLLWRRLDRDAGRSWTSARILREATALLRSGAGTETGPILAAVTGRESAALAGFLRALPDVTLAPVAARPVRERHLRRVAQLFGDEARQALASAASAPKGPSERAILAGYLFASPEVLADAGRPRSRGPDGTVSLEEYAGVEAEVEAAAEWVAREVLERKTPLAEVAVLVPTRGPIAGMVASRIARLPWSDGPFPVHLAGGIPLVATSGGSRALALVRALRSFLPAESMAAILPSLRARRGQRGHLSTGEATRIAWSVGTVGGSPANPRGALEWSEGAAAREAQLAAAVATLGPEAERRGGFGLRADLEAVRAALPALAALVEVARGVVEGRPLSQLGPVLLSFMEAWYLDPGPGAPIHALLGDDLARARTDAVGTAVLGADALAVVEDRLLSHALPTVRFGRPAVYVGTLASASGLDFEAVRILGLCEGALPSAPREDAVLPDAMREEASPLLPLSGDRVLAEVHAFDRAIRSARARLALSVPHGDLERSERETSSLLVEVGAALGRPDAANGGVVPDLPSLARTSFGPAREEAAAYRRAHPLTPVQWLHRAVVTGEVPPSWRAGAHLDLPRILALHRRTALGPADGILGHRGPFPVLPGLAAERPVSASALEALVSCPLRFLLERVLNWKEPAGEVSVRELDALTFGATLHDVCERFYSEHGTDFVARRGTLAHWKKVMREIADAAFTALRASYPLVGRGVEEKERGRLLQDLETFVEYDWKLRLSRFVAVEKAFDGMTLDAGGRDLHVRGYIDRIDVEGDHGLVRDIKTGSDHPRTGDEEGPTPARDIQLGLYGLVAQAKRAEWGLPARLEAAYIYAHNGEERAFRDDHAALERATRGWLAVAAGLLADRSFPPTPVPDDCTYCAFAPICGVPVRERAKAARPGSEGAVRAFLDLKIPEEAE